jgi:hypothetical protein
MMNESGWWDAPKEQIDDGQKIALGKINCARPIDCRQLDAAQINRVVRFYNGRNDNGGQYE